MKMKTLVIKTVSLLLIATSILSTLVGCKNKDNNATVLSFKEALEYEFLKTLDGKTVSINGYMATSSPVDGSFMFLMNLPYQSCPFCVPNTSQLSNTMEIYPKDGEKFSYTSMAIKVVGTLVVSESEDEPFTDKYGYEFNFKIVDATYTIMKSDEMSADMALWQKIADSDVVNDIYKMYDYLNFLCAWNTYYVRNTVDENGDTVPGYYLWPADAQNYIYPDGAQFNYGYKDGYFDSLIARIEAVDKTAFADLVANIRKAEALAQKALDELEAGNYTYEVKYIEMFGREDKVYSLNKGHELQSEMNTIYKEFSVWLGSWEM